MKKAPIVSISKRKGVSTLAGLAMLLLGSQVAAQNQAELQINNSVVEQEQQLTLPIEQRTLFNYDSYILGPGDGLEIELLDLPELSGVFSIGPDGSLYLPRLRALYVEGLSIEELRIFLTQQFSIYARDPEVYVRPVIYRPIRVYVGGEVSRPGFYTLSMDVTRRQLPGGASTRSENMDMTRPGLGQLRGGASARSENTDASSFGPIFPTVFDAIRSAQGITPYTDLSQVQVIRKRAESLGGGRIKTNLNFLSVINEGNSSQNIRLFDGDTINIGKSNILLRDQLLKAGQSNLNPRFMEVFVTGRVEYPGPVRLPQGSTLNQAISLAGGTKLLKGKVEFLRFNREGTIDRRIFSYKSGASVDAPNNPVLAAGDLIKVNESIISGTAKALNELTTPFVGLYSAYYLFTR